MISKCMRPKSLLRIQTPGAAPTGVTPAFEALEPRLLLSGDNLIGLSEYMVYPQTHYGYAGQVNYDAQTDSFASDATPYLWIGPGAQSWSLIQPHGILAEVAVSPGGEWGDEKFYIPLDDTHYMCRKVSQTQFDALGTTASGEIGTPPAYYIPDGSPNVFYLMFEESPGFYPPQSDRDFNDAVVKVELHGGTATLTPWDLPGSPYNMFLVDPITHDDLSNPSDPQPIPQWGDTAQPTLVTGTNTRSFDLQLQVDDSGNLIGGTPGDDLRIFGMVDTADNGTLSGVLLTGEILDFGYYDHGSTYEEFDFLFQPTGGALMPYFGTMKGGLYMMSYGSDFTGDFTTNFSGTTFGYLGPVERPAISMDKFVRVETVTDEGPGSRTYNPRTPVTLTFDYTGGGEDATDTYQRWNQYSVGGDPDDAPVVDIIASSKAKFENVLPENTYYSGQVTLGEQFVVAVDNAATSYSSTSTSQHTPNLFKPDTYIYILDHATGEVLQSIKYHTSGSEPIVAGDVIGGLTLTGFSFPDGKGAKVGQEPPEITYGDDADEGPGMQVFVGDSVTWTYVVSNPGDVPLANVTVADDNATPGDTGDDFEAAPIMESGFNVGDTNMDGLLDMDETWLFRFWDVVSTEGQFVNTGKAAGYYAARNLWVEFEDPAHYEVTMPAIDVAALGQRPRVLVMRYTGDGPDATTHSQDPVHVSVTGDPNDRAVVRIVAASRADVSDSKTEIYFDGEVALGDLFAIDAADAGATKLSAGMFLFIHDPATNELLQMVTFHTSCSQQMVLGDQFGAAELTGYLGWRGSRLGLVPVELLTTLSGFVYEDFNDDRMVDFNEHAIENVQVTLTGTNDRGQEVYRSEVTDEDGVYFFDNLRPGTYTITQVAQPAGYDDGSEWLGTAGGVLGNDVFTDIRLRPYVDGTNYNFGERPVAGAAVQAGQTATIGFWAGRKGQQLLERLNGGGESRQLGDWLAATFPDLYGDLAGKKNMSVGQTFIFLFKRARRKDAHKAVLELEAQVMATALAVYVTNSNLAGYVAQDYGFVVSSAGLAAATWNVGSSGAAFGVADGTEMTVMELLLAANARAERGDLYDDMDMLLRSLANEVFRAINELGV